jgi:hypothetical protein
MIPREASCVEAISFAGLRNTVANSVASEFLMFLSAIDGLAKPLVNLLSLIKM